MKDHAFRVEYFATAAEDKPGEGDRLMHLLKEFGIRLLALSVFPLGKGMVQVDLVPENPEELIRASRRLGLNLGLPKTAFLIQGTDRPGAMCDALHLLGNAGINVRATLGAAAGEGHYGGLLWVDQKDVELSAKVLGARSVATHHV